MTAAGYVTDVAYIPGFYPHLSPVAMRHVAALNGVLPPRTDAGFRVLELGCGLGRSLTTLAAANPRGEFVGVDVNPEHTAAVARDIAAGGLGNCRIVTADFGHLPDDLGTFDFLSLHGVYSWVAPSVREEVIAIARERLNPGGLLLVSYNAMPGWAHLQPIRGILQHYASLRQGDSMQRIRDALAYVVFLRDNHAKYFDDNPRAAAYVDALRQQDPRYLAHEYLNEHWTSFYFSEVADAFGTAGLSFTGSLPVHGHAVTEGLDPRGEGGCRLPVAGRGVGGHRPLERGEVALRGRQIDPHGDGQQRRAGQAMGRAALDAQRRRHAVRHAEAGVRQRDAREQRGVGHGRPRTLVGGMLDRRRQRRQCPRQRLDRQRPRHGPREPADERFDELRDRVQPRRGGRAPVAGERQPWIDDRHPRHHQRAAHALLEAAARAGDDGVAGRLGAGAGGGGHGDHRQGRHVDGQAAPHTLEAIDHRGVEVGRVGGHVRRQRRDGLREVDRRTAADGDHHGLGPAVPRQTGDRRHNLVDRGLAGRRGHQSHAEAEIRQVRLQPLQQACPDEASLAADEPRRPPQAGGDGGDLRRAARTEPDRRRHGEVVGGQRQA
jgi:SAM-dependent methyltransferase